MKQAIGLVDCNNFFVSCERVFSPEFNNHPTVVLSNNDGCVIARSQEVKDLGVPMGIPVFKIKDLIKKHNIKIFSSNFNLYRDMSERIMSILDSFDFIEVKRYSIDEAFIYFNDNNKLKDKCLLIINTIYKYTGISVSVGLSTSKTLAKLANKIAKDNQIAFFEINQKNIEKIYEEVTIGKVWGIGKKISERLNDLNIQTVGEFIKLDNNFVRKQFGVIGERLKMDLLGHDSVVGDCNQFSKTIVSSSSFGSKSLDFDEIESSLIGHMESASRQIRNEKRVAGFISIFIRTNRFSNGPSFNLSKSVYLDTPTSDIFELIKITKDLLNEIFIPNVEYSKSGIMLSDFKVAGSLPKFNLFNKSVFPRQEINEVIDKIRDKFGNEKLSFASKKFSNRLRPNKKMLSAEYTTKKEDILSILSN